MMNWLQRIDDFTQTYLTAGPTLMRQMRVAMSDVPAAQRGLIIIQIDGLSAQRFQRAVRRRKMPFIMRMLRKRKIIMQEYQSEIPTSTPAFQAGMFYGNNDNIPGFQFFDKQQGRYYKMGYSDCAFSVQESFTKPGLLTGGSVFSSVYNGDADASLFIFSSLLAPRRWRFALKAWDVVVLLVLHLVVGTKILVMALIELLMAVFDLMRGTKRRWGWKRELEVVGLRVGLSVITRELITLGTIIDINRQVPVIYLNYLSYDEHAHIRGPNSRFATWSLRAVDRCVRRIFRAAGVSERKYDVFVLSDHGQSDCRPFDHITGCSLRAVIQQLLPNMPVADSTDYEEKLPHLRETGQATQRLAEASPWLLGRLVDWVGRNILRRVQNDRLVHEPVHHGGIVVISTGPIAYIYWTHSADKVCLEDIEEKHPGFIESLSKLKAVGMITATRRDGRIEVFSADGHAILWEDRIESRSGRLPFDSVADVAHVVRGLARVTRFVRSGDICVWGGNSRAGDISFSEERGCHCGWTEEETQAFILKPADVAHDFSSIRQHAQFYDYFYPRYAAANVAAGEDNSMQFFPSQVTDSDSVFANKLA